MICVFVLFSTAQALCEEHPSLLHIVMLNGETFSFQLSERPKLTFIDGNLVVKTSDFDLVESKYIASDIRKIWFYEYKVPTEISGLKRDEIRISYVDGQILNISGLVKQPFFSVYSISGSKVTPKMGYSDGILTMDFSELPKAIYVLKINETKFKIKTK